MSPSKPTTTVGVAPGDPWVHSPQHPGELAVVREPELVDHAVLVGYRLRSFMNNYYRFPLQMFGYWPNEGSRPADGRYRKFKYDLVAQ